MGIGSRMKECRQILGYSAEQVANFLSVSPATVYRYEKGDITKMPSTILKPLADLLNTTPAYLMGWSDEGKPSARLSDDELHLLQVYRAADPTVKHLATEMLENHPAASISSQKEEITP